MENAATMARLAGTNEMTVETAFARSHKKIVCFRNRIRKKNTQQLLF